MKPINQKQLVALVILAGANILVGLWTDTGGRTLEGRGVAVHSPQMRQAIISSCLVGLQFIGFLLGAPLAAIPYKHQPYPEKLVTFSLTIALGLQILFLLAGLRKLLL